jgi:hypothetical protein
VFLRERAEYHTDIKRLPGLAARECQCSGLAMYCIIFAQSFVGITVCEQLPFDIFPLFASFLQSVPPQSVDKCVTSLLKNGFGVTVCEQLPFVNNLFSQSIINYY